MTDQEIIDTIAAAAHPWESYVADDGNKSVRSLESPAIAANVFAALRERYAIVELPKPDDGPDGAGGYAWGTTVAPVSTCYGQVWMEDCDMDPDWAEELAAALLAAADQAEESK